MRPRRRLWKNLGSAKTALRHLKTHVEQMFGTYNPVLPVGMGGDQLRGTYAACALRGLVSQRDGKKGSGETTLSIAPTMSDVLDELLYDSDAE